MQQHKQTLWTRDFSLLTIATALGAAGGVASEFALSFLVFDKTGSTLASALILAIRFIPGFFVPLFAAPWLDRLPRKPFLVFGDLTNGILYALAGFYLLTHPFNYAGYVCFSLLLACLGSFDQLAYNSIYPNLIPKGMEEKGYAVSSMLYPVIHTLMMPLAAVLMDTIGVAGILIGQGVLSISAAITENQISLKEQNRLHETSYSFAAWKRDLLDGFAYIKKEKGLQGIFAYTSIAGGVATGYGPVLIAFFRSTPGFTSGMYAFFSVVEFLGRSIGSALQYKIRIPNKKKFGISFFIYQFYDLLDMILLFSPYPLMLANRAVCGFLGANSATMRAAAMQKYIPDEYRARVNAFDSICFLAAGSILTLVIGTLGELLDYRLCMTLCGLVPAIVCWLSIWKNRRSIEVIYESV